LVSERKVKHRNHSINMTEKNEHTGDKVGRPTKYKEEYCNKLIEHMAEGYSFDSFAGIVEVHIDTLYEWAKVHKEFSDAKHIGTAKSMAWWEKIGRMGMVNEIPFFNDRIWRLNMINRFRTQWSDGTKNENNDKVKTEIIVKYGNKTGGPMASDSTSDTGEGS
jgi:hypothetical protein